MSVLLVGLMVGCGAAPADAPPRFGLMTLNVANGAGDRYRTAMTRTVQQSFIAQSTVVALQEVDVGVTRSGDVNTALVLAGPEFEGCHFQVAQAPHLSADGALRCDSAAGTVLFGLSLRGSDAAGMPLGITDEDLSLNPKSVDRGFDALYGNALILRGAAAEFVAVVGLPADAAPPEPGAYAALVASTPERRASHNLDIRSRPGLEPRSALLARLSRRGAPTLSVINVHLSSGDVEPLRLTQLGAVVEMAQAERASGRELVVMGDLNLSVAQAASRLSDAGFVSASSVALDQLWVDSALTLLDANDVPGEGATDHAYAITAIVE